MNAFLLIPTDTIAIRDSIVVKVMNVTGTCQPIIKEAETNWQDVTIVFFICAAIVVIATYGICRFFTYKTKEQEEQNKKETQKHNWDVEEKVRKQKADLLEKKLQFLQDLCKEEEPKKGIKKYNSEEVTNYLSALNEAMGITSKSQESPKGQETPLSHSQS